MGRLLGGVLASFGALGGLGVWDRGVPIPASLL